MRNFTRFITKNSEHTQGVQGNGMQPGSQECIWRSDGVPGTSCPANAWWKNDAFQAHHSLTTNGFPGADDSWIEDRLFNQLAISAIPWMFGLDVNDWGTISTRTRFASLGRHHI